MVFKCPFHPKYKAIRAPRADCWFCDVMYEWACALANIDRDR